MNDVHDVCIECGEGRHLKRIPASFHISTPSFKKNKVKAGEVVKETIESAKEELRLEQEELKKRTYEN